MKKLTPNPGGVPPSAISCEHIDDKIENMLNDIEIKKEAQLVELLVKFIVRMTLTEYYEKTSNQVSQV